jgi:DNA repair photolyase
VFVYDVGVATLGDLQRAPGVAGPIPAAGLSLPVERAVTVDTPDFAGMTFLEVQTKSALNKVSGMPFGWSINLYRGCQHACSYCLVPETPVLMADGRVRAIGELRVGDEVVGTERQGRYRRFVQSTVQDRWQTRKPAYRVVLADGTEMLASGDHRFLSDRGWTHVVGAEQGSDRRPHLTTSNELLGPGGFPSPPKHDADYEVGYLAGMIRGDGSIGTYAYDRSGRTSVVHRFRLALIDLEGLDRSQAYLAAHGVPTDRFAFSPAVEGRHAALTAIRTSRASAVDRVRQLVAWPAHPSEEWHRGFLAGIFDADGSHSGTVMRISNGDSDILSWTRRSMERLGITHVQEPASPNGVCAIRVTGGLPMRLRFILATAPAIERKRRIDDVAVRGAGVGIRSIEPVGLTLPMVDITTSTGDFVANGVISHNCFARPTHRYLNLSATGDFDTKVVVKTNLVEVLRAELARPSWKGEHVALGTNTDPYQRAEGRYRLMPGVIRALADSLTPFSILTKGTLVTRDIELLQQAAERVPVAASMTVGMLDEAVWRSAEPGVPSPRARLDAVRRLNEAGIPTGVMLAPIMPRLNDDHAQLTALTEAAVDAGATHVTPIGLRLQPGVKEAFWPWLEDQHPDLVGHYAALYGAPGTKGRSRLPATVEDPLLAVVRRTRTAAWRRRGGPPDAGAWPDRARPGENESGHRVGARPPVPQPAQQLSLLT